jgi:hypothetical protein
MSEMEKEFEGKAKELAEGGPMLYQEQGSKIEGIHKMAFEDLGNELRKKIKVIGDEVFATKQHSIFSGEQSYVNCHSEMQANIMLTYRHLEDARMRVGKIMQAYQGGVSILDK